MQRKEELKNLKTLQDKIKRFIQNTDFAVGSLDPKDGALHRLVRDRLDEFSQYTPMPEQDIGRLINDFSSMLSDTKAQISQKAVNKDLAQPLLDILDDVVYAVSEVPKISPTAPSSAVPVPKKSKTFSLSDFKSKPMEEIVKALLDPAFTDETAKQELAKVIFGKRKLGDRNYREELGEDPDLIIRLLLNGNDVIRKAMDDAKLLETSALKAGKEKVVKVYDILKVSKGAKKIPADVLLEMIQEIKKDPTMPEIFFSNPQFLSKTLGSDHEAWLALFDKLPPKAAFVQDAIKTHGLLANLDPEAWFYLLRNTEKRKYTTYKMLLNNTFVATALPAYLNLIKNHPGGIEEGVKAYVFPLAVDSVTVPSETIANILKDPAIAKYLRNISLNDLFTKLPLLIVVLKDYPNSLIEESLMEGKTKEDVAKGIIFHLQQRDNKHLYLEDHAKYLVQLSSYLPDRDPLRVTVTTFFAKPTYKGMLSEYAAKLKRLDETVKGGGNPIADLRAAPKAYDEFQLYWKAYFDKLTSLKSVMTELSQKPEYASLEPTIKKELGITDNVTPLQFIEAELGKWHENNKKYPLYQPEQVGIVLDLLEYPKPNERFPLKSGEALIIGDLHGNALKLVKALLQHNMIDFSEKDYYQLIDILRKPNISLNKQDIQAFKDLLQKIHVKEGTFSLKLIGDVLADRAGNDYFTLKLLQQLIKDSLSVKVLMSNHDSVFIEHLDTHLGKSDDFQTRISSGEQKQDPSLMNLNRLIRKGLVDLQEVKDLFKDVYQPILKLIDYDIVRDANNKIIKMNVRTHAFVANDPATLVHYLDNLCSKSIKEGGLGLQKIDRARLPESLVEKIDEINKAFSGLLDNRQQLREMLNMLPSDGVPSAEMREKFPFLATFWNRSYAQLVSDLTPAELAKLNFLMEFEHGHDGLMTRTGNVFNLNNVFGDSLARTTVPLKDAGMMARDAQGRLLEYAAIAKREGRAPDARPRSDSPPRGPAPQPSPGPGVHIREWQRVEPPTESGLKLFSRKPVPPVKKEEIKKEEVKREEKEEKEEKRADDKKLK